MIVTCYNLGHFLREALDSVHGQTYQELEIIIVDDGSTDTTTLEQLTRLASQERILCTPNRGLPAARNTGVQHSRGQYVCCLDADDQLTPTYLAQSVALLDAHPEFAFASHWLEAFGDEQWSWQPMRSDLAALLDANMINGAALFRRTLWDDIGGFDESMTDGCEDWEFWLRATIAGHRGVILPAVLHRYRRRAQSMSRTMNKEQLYAELVRRQPAAFLAHLPDLLLRREHTLATLQRSIEVMESEIEVLNPALEERQRELTSARSRLAEHRRTENLERAYASCQWEATEQRRRADWLSAEREDLLLRLTEAELAGLAATADAQAQTDALLHSWSWRITSPLRWIAAQRAKRR